jgi:single-strand DNA-binding protein
MSKCGFWLVGRLTKDAEIKVVGDGIEVAQFSVAVDGYKKDEVSFFDCKWFKPSGLKAYLKKGKGFLMSGEMRQERWEKDGQQRSRIVLNVRSVDFVPGDSKQQDNNEGLPTGLAYRDPVQAPDLDSDLGTPY